MQEPTLAYWRRSRLCCATRCGGAIGSCRRPMSRTWCRTSSFRFIVVRATYDPERPFLPWLFGIAHNRIADAARRYARRNAHELIVDQVPETFSGEPANMENAYRDPEALKLAIAALPRGQREAL